MFGSSNFLWEKLEEIAVSRKELYEKMILTESWISSTNNIDARLIINNNSINCYETFSTKTVHFFQVCNPLSGSTNHIQI